MSKASQSQTAQRCEVLAAANEMMVHAVIFDNVHACLHACVMLMHYSLSAVGYVPLRWEGKKEHYI